MVLAAILVSAAFASRKPGVTDERSTALLSRFYVHIGQDCNSMRSVS